MSEKPMASFFQPRCPLSQKWASGRVSHGQVVPATPQSVSPCHQRLHIVILIVVFIFYDPRVPLIIIADIWIIFAVASLISMHCWVGRALSVALLGMRSAIVFHSARVWIERRQYVFGKATGETCNCAKPSQSMRRQYAVCFQKGHRWNVQLCKTQSEYEKTGFQLHTICYGLYGLDRTSCCGHNLINWCGTDGQTNKWTREDGDWVPQYELLLYMGLVLLTPLTNWICFKKVFLSDAYHLKVFGIAQKFYSYLSRGKRPKQNYKIWNSKRWLCQTFMNAALAKTAF